MSLTAQLKEKAAQSANKIPETIQKIMNNGIDNLRDSQLITRALKTGDKIPEISLPNTANKTISIQELLLNKNVVISFYRGGWCPYCNMELKALQDIVPQLNKVNAGLIAISPETPDVSLTTAEKNELKFAVLSDIDNTYAKSLGLAFKMPEDLQRVYKEFNINVDKHNGNQNFELPMPATYVVNKEREIISSFVPEDYTERLDPETILEVLKNQ